VYRFQEEIKLFPTEKGEIDFKNLFKGRSNMNRKTYVSDMSGVLDKLKASLPDQNFAIVNFYDTIKYFEVEMKF
jgi:hypothetical protein